MDNRRKVLPCLLLGLFSLGCYFTWDNIHYSNLHRDAGWFFQSATWIARGYRPWVDYIDIYPPLVQLLHVPFIMGGVSRALLPPVSALFWNLLIAGGTYGLARSFKKEKSFSGLLAALYLFFQIPYGGDHLVLEFGVILFTLFSLWVVRTKKSSQGIFLAGVLFGLALSSKQTALILAIPIVGLLYRDSELRFGRVVGLWLLGCLLPPLIIFLWTIGSPRGVTSLVFASWERLGFYTGRPTWRVPDLVFEFRRAPLSSFLILLSLFVGVVSLFRQGDGKRKLFLGLAASSLVLCLVPRGIKDYIHYTLICWPCIVLLLCASEFTLSRRWQISTVCALTLVSLILSMGRFRESFFAVSLLGFGEHPKPARFKVRRASFLRDVADKVKTLVPPGSPILVISGEPSVEFLSGMVVQDFESAEWDLRAEYFKDKGNLTVLFDRGQPGLSDKRASLAKNDYQLVFKHLKRPGEDDVEIWMKATP